MKIKLFANSNIEKLENSVNEFLSTLDKEQVIDIKYSTNTEYSEIMIRYNETKAAE